MRFLLLVTDTDVARCAREGRRGRDREFKRMPGSVGFVNEDSPLLSGTVLALAGWG